MKRLSVRIPHHLWAKIKGIAAYEGLTLNALISEELMKFIEEQEKKRTKEKGEKL